MIKIVHLERRVEKQIQGVARAGKKGALAANKARTIIENLVHGHTDDFSQLGSMTKNGEARIDKCLKYDLGAGYRMVCVWDEECFCPLFVGSHDECDRWLEGNRGFSISRGLNEGRTLKVQRIKHAPQPARSADIEETDHFFPESIDQRTLRKVFCGLCGQNH